MLLADRREEVSMEIVGGTATFPGIAIGGVRYFYRAEKKEGKDLFFDVQEELQRLYAARDCLIKELEEKMEMAPGEESEDLTGERELLDSPSFFKALEEMIFLEKVYASYAITVTSSEMEEAFGSLETPAIRKKLRNIRQVSSRMLEILAHMMRKEAFLKEPAIVVADALSPAQMLGMGKENLLGIITRVGSSVAHASIIAKSLNIPILEDVDVDTNWDGKQIVVDGYTGTVYIEPDEETQKEYEIRKESDLQEKEALLSLRDQEDVTLDGRKVGIYANIGSTDDLNSVKYYGAAGIGLIRSEFQYLGRENYPGEDELYRSYRKIAEAMGEKLAIIRTVDLGADKKSDYMNIPVEVNPIMGNRGIRFCLDHREILKTQLRAIYRAGVCGRLAVMYPMITSLEEVRELKLMEEEVKEDLEKEGIPYCKKMEKGIMVETPAAVMISRELAGEVDFLSLGTNDLTQYTLAMDRANPNLKEKYCDRHPAILRMIEMVVREGHKENCQVMICGELAADVSLTKDFLKMGVDALSVVPACILPVRKALRSSRIRETEE